MLQDDKGRGNIFFGQILNFVMVNSVKAIEGKIIFHTSIDISKCLISRKHQPFDRICMTT